MDGAPRLASSLKKQAPPPPFSVWIWQGSVYTLGSPYPEMYTLDPEVYTLGSPYPEVYPGP